MKDDEKLELLLERFYNRYNKYNTRVLRKMGETIKKFEGVTPTVAHQIAQELKMGTDIDELMLELSSITKLTIDDIYKAFDIIAEDNEEFAEIYAKAKKKELDKQKLDKIVKAISRQTSKNMINLSNTRTVGFTFERKGKKVFAPFKKTYTNLIDEAVYNVEIGVQDYQSAMRNTIKQLADSGVRVNESKIKYKSGYSRRIDSSVRQDVLTGVRQLNIELQQEIGQQLGADGVEISAHFPCAEDHLPIQGRQYSNKEFERLNRTLDRPIGEYNCRHFVFSIIMGVNRPSYTKAQLKKLNDDSMQKITYNGKEYTKYEASQVQRKFETEIRKQKDRQIIAKSSGDNQEIQNAQDKITKLTKEYINFSEVADLRTYKNRLTVAGYKRVAKSKLK